MKIIDIIGSSVSQTQEKVIIDKNKQKFCSSDNPEGCGSVSDLLSKQAEIQQLCDAIDLQDQIKENNQRIQKNRQYIMQLEDHDKKIANLEDVVQKMKHLRTLREKANDQGVIDQKSKQDEIDLKLQQLVQDRKNSQSQFNVKLNIKPGSLDGLQTTVNRLMTQTTPTGAPSTTARTPLEGFANYSQLNDPESRTPKIDDPFENRWLEHKFKLKMQEKTSLMKGFNDQTYLEQQFEQVMNPGFDYVDYVDNTNKMQKNTPFKLNNKMFDDQDPGYVYQSSGAKSGFYEDVALRSSKCDTNLKFIKKLN
jgi:hypothetical protein